MSIQTDNTQQLIQEAIEFHQCGQFQEAERLYRQILEIEPNNPDANHLLGVIEAQAGRYTQAIKFISLAIEKKPSHSGYYRDLGLAFRLAGRMEDAISAFKQSVQIDPPDGAAWILLGEIYQAQGASEKAAAAFKEALQITPDDADLHNKLGNAYSAQGEYEKAVKSFKQALHIQPEFVEAHYNLGNAFRDLDQLDHAADAYQSAIRMKPDLALAHHNLGVVFQNQKKFKDAVNALTEAIRLQPDSAYAHYNLGSVYRDLGKLEETKASCEKAIAIKPDLAEAHHMMVKLKRYTVYDDHAGTLEILLRNPKTSDLNRIYLNFALGKIYEDMEEYDKAFACLKDGNRIKRETFIYDIEQDFRFFSELKDVFTSQLFEQSESLGNGDPTPIFVLGMPRSGTSLVEQILSSHPKVKGSGELNILSQIVLNYCQDTKDRFPGQVSQFDKEDFHLLGLRYIESIRQYSSSKDYIVDKMPHNFMYVGMIKLMLPNAKIIHCKRDPMDTCWSIFKTLFTSLHGYAYDLIELGRYYRNYRDLTNHWQREVPEQIHNIRYEELVEDQEKETARLLDYCGLKWDDSCMSFHKTERPVCTASAVQVRNPIYNSSIHRWKQYKHHLKGLLIAIESDSA